MPDWLPAVDVSTFGVKCNGKVIIRKNFVNCAVFGEMQEWLNWLAWKASIPLKGIGGSNPPLSATIK